MNGTCATTQRRPVIETCALTSSNPGDLGLEVGRGERVHLGPPARPRQRQHRVQPGWVAARVMGEVGEELAAAARPDQVVPEERESVLDRAVVVGMDGSESQPV